MSRSLALLERSHELESLGRFEEAAALIFEERSKDPHDPDLAAELGVLLCFCRRESEAVELLNAALGGARVEQLASILRNHFFCRMRMAERLHAADDEARSLFEIVSQHVQGDPVSVDVTVSAVLIVKDEESRLARCLNSVATIVDEIVVVDTGSSDQTIEIAKSYGAKIGHFDWINDFAAARNESLRLASSQWVLWVDADEELAAGSAAALREGLVRPHFGGYFATIIDLMEETEPANASRRLSVRLFQRLEGIRFKGRIHEQISPSIESLGLPIVSLGGLRMLHHGFKAEVMGAKDKVERNVALIEEELKDDPQNAFHWFNLALAYSSADRYPEAEAAARQSILYLEPGAGFGSLAFQLLSTSLVAQTRFEEALAVCDQAVEAGFSSSLTAFDRATSLLNLGRLSEAIKSIDACIAMDWPEGMPGDYSIRTHKARVVRAQILSDMGRQVEAAQELITALKVAPNDPVAQQTRAIVLRRAQQG